MSKNIVNYSENDVERIAATFNRTPKSIDEDVKQLQEWMKSQPHLPETLGEAHIRLFLFFNKCSTETTKQKINMYYTIRTLIPDFYENANPKTPNMQKVMDIFYTVLVPQLTKEMYRVIIVKFRRPDLLNPKEVTAHMVNVFEIRLFEDVSLKDIFIWDCADMPFNYATKLTPTYISKLMTVYNKVFSMRLAGLYIINAPSFMSGVVAIMKSVMKPKIFERVYVCKNTEILDEFSDKKILPREYGGEGQSLEELHNAMKMKLGEYQWRFDQLDTLRVDESLRPEELKNDEILGFHGNFKQLGVD